MKMKKLTAILLALVMTLAVLALASCQPAEQNVKQELLSDLKEYKDIKIAEEFGFSDFQTGYQASMQLKINEFSMGLGENMLPGPVTIGFDGISKGNNSKAEISLGYDNDVFKLGAITDGTKLYINADGKSNYYYVDAAENETADVAGTLYSYEEVQKIYDAVIKYVIKLVEAIPETAINTEDGYALKLDGNDMLAIMKSVVADLKADEETKALIIKYAGQEAYDSFVSATEDTDELEEDNILLTVKKTEKDGEKVTETHFVAEETETLTVTTTEKKGEKSICAVFVSEGETVLDIDYTEKDVEGGKEHNITVVSDDLNATLSSTCKDGVSTGARMEITTDDAKIEGTHTSANGKADTQIIICTKEYNPFSTDQDYTEVFRLKVVSEKEGDSDKIAAEAVITNSGASVSAKVNGTATKEQFTGTLECEAIGLKADITCSGKKSDETVTIPENATPISELDSDAKLAELMEAHSGLYGLLEALGLVSEK